MRAIFINAMEQKVEEIQVENELHAFYKQIGCEMIQCVDLGENHTLVCDEEARLKPQTWGFRLAGPTVIADRSNHRRWRFFRRAGSAMPFLAQH